MKDDKKHRKPERKKKGERPRKSSNLKIEIALKERQILDGIRDSRGKSRSGTLQKTRHISTYKNI